MLRFAAVLLFLLSSAEGKFIPPTGRYFFLGQDVDSIGEYISNTSVIPAGVHGYTTLVADGLTSPQNYGAGKQFMGYMVEKYQKAMVMVSVWVVGLLDTVISGAQNDNIDNLVRTLVAFNRPVFMRFAYEADYIGNKYDPQQYQQAWRIVFKRIQAAGAGDKIAMVWALAAACEGTYGGHPMEAWFPGQQYVDWMGVSIFTQADCGWKTGNAAMAIARQYKLPVMIAESTPRGYDVVALTHRDPGDKTGSSTKKVTSQQIWSGWFEGYMNFIYTNKDVIRGVTYISADWNAQSMWAPPYANGYWGDSRTTANAYIRSQWLAELAKPSWLQAANLSAML